MDFEFFEQLLTIFGAAFVVAVLFSRLRIPAIIAYMVAGALIGPHIFALVEAERFTLIAEFGVVFLLFSLGLEFSLPRMLKLKRLVFGLGGAQVLLTTALFSAAVYFWGAGFDAAIVIAGALALSSTAIVTRELAARQQFDTRYAQVAIAVLLFQDLVAVVFLILVPVLGAESDGLFLSLGIAFVKGVALLVFMMLIGKFVLPFVYHEVARTRSDDVFVLSTLLIALLAAWLTHAFQLSMALGAFVIGMMLSEGPFRHRIESDIRPFKDVLLGLFFVTVGMTVDVGVISEHGLRVAIFTVALIILNITIVAILARLFGESRDTALRVGITLAQAGEFGLALLVLANLHGVLALQTSSFIIAIAVLSMFLSPLLIAQLDSLSGVLARLWGQREQALPVTDVALNIAGDHVIVGGFGRVGETVAHLLRNNAINYVGIERDPDRLRRVIAAGEPAIFGDCTDLEVLQHCQLASARLAILTFRSFDLAKQTIEQVRELGIDTPIIVRCYENADFEELIAVGADRVIPEMLEGSLIIGGQVLAFLGLDATEIDRQLNKIREI